MEKCQLKILNICLFGIVCSLRILYMVKYSHRPVSVSLAYVTRLRLEGKQLMYCVQYFKGFNDIAT
jgi:hypothetical protein